MIQKFNHSSRNFPPGETAIVFADAITHLERQTIWDHWRSFLRTKHPASEQAVYYYLFHLLEFRGKKYLNLFSETLWIYPLPDEQ